MRSRESRRIRNQRNSSLISFALCRSNREDRGVSWIHQTRILDYQIEIISTETVGEQVLLNADGSVAPSGLIKLKQESKYTFICHERRACTCSDNPHQMEIHDWEVNELYRHVIEKDKKPPVTELKMRKKWFDWMTTERDTYFMMGTHHRWKNWMIVSVLYLRKPGESESS